jgi:hypothetical protein
MKVVDQSRATYDSVQDDIGLVYDSRTSGTNIMGEIGSMPKGSKS